MSVDGCVGLLTSILSPEQNLAGFVLLEDSTPDQPELLVSQNAPKILVAGVSEDEPAPPEPFEYRA